MPFDPHLSSFNYDQLTIPPLVRIPKRVGNRKSATLPQSCSCNGDYWYDKLLSIILNNHNLVIFFFFSENIVVLFFFVEYCIRFICSPRKFRFFKQVFFFLKTTWTIIIPASFTIFFKRVFFLLISTRAASSLNRSMIHQSIDLSAQPAYEPC